MDIFARMSQSQTFIVISLFTFLIWLLAMFALFSADTGLKSIIFGHGNIVQQGFQK